MRGIRFQIPNLHDRYLEKIFENVSVEEYDWIINEESEIFIGRSNGLFEVGVINGVEMKKRICIDKYYLVFVNFQAIPSGCEYYDLIDYNSYMKSKCVMVLFVTDSMFVEFYAKNEEVILQIKSNAEKYCFSEIEFITDENFNNESFQAS